MRKVNYAPMPYEPVRAIHCKMDEGVLHERRIWRVVGRSKHGKLIVLEREGRQTVVRGGTLVGRKV